MRHLYLRLPLPATSRDVTQATLSQSPVELCERHGRPRADHSCLLLAQKHAHRRVGMVAWDSPSPARAQTLLLAQKNAHRHVGMVAWDSRRQSVLEPLGAELQTDAYEGDGELGEGKEETA